MKKLFVILSILILSYGFISAQENLFEKTDANFTSTKSVNEKIERLKSREAIKRWEQVMLKPNIVFSKKFKGVFNIFDKSIEFGITKDFWTDVNGVQGFKAELKDGGYAILSSSINGIGASIWYKENFYSIEAVEDGIYFISEVDISEIAKHNSPNDYGGINKLNKTTQNSSVTSVLSPATIKVFVAYTSAVSQNYPSIGTFINQCRNTTIDAFQNSLVSSSIDIVGYQQLTYTESGNSVTDVNRFMTNNDGYMDEIHSLRNQYQADMCVLLVNSLTDGTNGQSATVGAQFASSFCVVKAGAAVSVYTFPHELGHLFGCRHDNDTGTQPYSNARGFNWYGKLIEYGGTGSRHFRTVMSTELEEKYMRVPYFSYPYVEDDLGNDMGTTTYNYCAYAIDDYASNIAPFEPYYTTSGTMNVNEWWSGTVNVTGNVTINSGVTLTIQPNTTIYFASGASLIVNGTLTAIGNSSSSITFNRSGTSGTWGGIQFNSGSSGNLQYCNIQNASYGIYCNNSSPTIDNCTISYCGTGIYCYNSSPTISNCTINNCGYGIYCDYYGSPTMSNNLIENCSSGVWCNGGSSPNLATSSASKNVIRNNTNDGVYATYGSNPTLGVTGLGGNSIYGNGIPTVRAIYSSNINAINNWWGAYPPSSSLFYTYYGTITYIPALSSNPNYSILVNNDTPVSGTKLGKSASVMVDDLDSALDKQKNKKYDDAISLYLEMFKNNKDSLVGKYALSKIEECFTQAGKKNFLDYSKKELKPIIKTATETFVVLLELETHQLVNARSYKEAMDNLFLIKDKYNLNEEIDKNTLYRIGVFYSDLYGDKKNAQKYFDELKTKYPKDDLVNDIDRWLNTTNGESKNGSYIAVAQTAEDTGTAEKTSVSVENYPNPFNPTTRIGFTIPQKGNVKLRVFDLLGREITILADGVYEAGKYEVSFDAGNLPSGVYFYSLTTESNSISKKMLLVK